MKLLIVDDEQLTRQGLKTSIKWKKFNITDIYEADDGMHGLELAKKYAPDIILCDVRMPRMNGLEMLRRIQRFLPDVVAIFMSGYSDKEYLKSAIKLHAIRYVEKPLNINEVEDAVWEAVKRYRHDCRAKQNEQKRQLDDTSSLALSLTLPESRKQSAAQKSLITELNLPIHANTVFNTWIIKFPLVTQLSTSFISELCNKISVYLKERYYNMIYTEKHLQHIVFHIYGSTAFSPQAMSDFEQFLQDICEPAKAFYIARGSSVLGIQNTYTSYEEAVLLLQSSFFFQNGTVLYPNYKSNTKKATNIQFSEFLQSFSSALQDKNILLCKNLLNQLYDYYSENRNLLPNDAKDMYYRLFMLIDDATHHFRLSIPELSGNGGNIISYLENCTSLDDLSQTIVMHTETLIQNANQNTAENSIVSIIKQYISQMYSTESLSVKDISEHVYMSTSYVCTLFKNETNQTLNQYITEYRISKAQQLLRDPRIKITEIAGKVGYSDSNYFGKSFKKIVGISPSEYRETIIS